MDFQFHNIEQDISDTFYPDENVTYTSEYYINKLTMIILNNGGVSAKPIELYEDMFHLGDHLIERTGEHTGKSTFKGNPIFYGNTSFDYETGRPDGRWEHFIMLEDTFEEQLKTYLDKYEYTLMNACTYYGKKKDKDRLDKVFALVFDLDEVEPVNLERFFSGAYSIWYPLPNYISVSKSGKGVHLYYILEEPIPLYPNIKIQMKDIKYHLTRKIWNRYTSEAPVQYQSFDQSFIVPGTRLSENNADSKIKLYKVNTHPWSLERLIEYIPSGDRHFDFTQLYQPSKFTLAQAKKKFPKWYERVIVNGEKAKQKRWEIEEKVHGKNPYALYDWWFDKITNETTYGHRYWCTMCLAIYAVKCSVPFDRLREDAYSLLPVFNGIKPDKPFLKSDVDTALKCYHEDYATFPLKDIERLTQITIQRNKRNGRTSEQHSKVMRAMKEVKKELGEKVNEGRPSKKAIVEDWQMGHPQGRKADCIKETGLSKPTVYKWWRE